MTTNTLAQSTSVSTAPAPSTAYATLHHYIIVRKDLPLGILAAQAVHAAGESSPGNLPEGTHAYVLSVPNETALRFEADRLERLGIPIVRVEEPDAPWNGQLMAIGIRPGRKEVLRKALSSLPLWRPR